jgi:uncharacterized SAM-binding protein YcdF (DUF218 family)
MSDFAQLLRAVPVPPVSLFLLAGLGLLVARVRPRLGRGIVALTCVTIMLLCVPVIATFLLRSLETRGDAVVTDAGGAGAIIVLSADVERDAPEYGGASIGPLTLVRLRYAAELGHRFSLPILVTGGRVVPSDPLIAPLMAQVLEREFGLKPKWVEDRSRTTYENAMFSARLLEADGVRSALVVTHSWHMPRALLSFAQADFAVRPAPTEFTTPFTGRFDEFVPSARAFEESSFAIHEWVGLIWYRLTAGRAGAPSPG